MRSLINLLMVLLCSLSLTIACSSDGGSSGGDDDAADDDATDDNGADSTDDADDDTVVDDDVVDDVADDATDDDLPNLTWENPPGSSIELPWEDAITYCSILSLDGHDDWRLPTINELRSLVRGCETSMPGGACGVTDDCLDYSCVSDACDGCKYDAGPGPNGAYWPNDISGYVAWYWSSSPITSGGGSPAWLIIFNSASFYGSAYVSSALTRCVRDS